MYKAKTIFRITSTRTYKRTKNENICQQSCYTVGTLIRDLKFWKKVNPKCMLSLINYSCYCVLVVVVRMNKSQYYKHNSRVLSSNIYIYQVTGYRILTEFICSFSHPPPKFLLTHYFSLSSGILWISHLLKIYTAVSITNVLLNMK